MQELFKQQHNKQTKFFFFSNQTSEITTTNRLAQHLASSVCHNYVINSMAFIAKEAEIHDVALALIHCCTQHLQKGFDYYYFGCVPVT